MGAYLVIQVPSSVTVRLQKNPKAKPFTAHIDKVKPYLRATPKSWAEGTSEAEDARQLAAELEDAATAGRTAQNEERGRNEPIAEASLQGSEACYGVDEGQHRRDRKGPFVN